MDKYVAVVFEDEESAYRGADAMRDLHRNAELTVYAAAVISKDADGDVKLKSNVDEGPIGTAFGITIGAMVGVLAGPAAVAAGAAAAGTAAAASAAASGMALGGMTGGLFGAYRDLWVSGMDSVMLDNISTELLPGKSCVVASVDEVWITPLDTKMTELGGTVFRKLRADAVDDEMAAEMDALNREWDAMDDEWRAANDEAKAAIKAKMDSIKIKMEETGEKIDTRMDEIDREFEARVQAIDEQIEKSTDATKAKFEKRKAEIKEEWQERKNKLAASVRKIADRIET